MSESISTKSYLDAIDQAIADSEPLQRWLDERAKRDRLRSDPSVIKFLSALQVKTPSGRWIEDSELASFLPFLLRGSRLVGGKPDGSSTAMDLDSLEPWYRLSFYRKPGYWQSLYGMSYLIFMSFFIAAVAFLVASFVTPTFASVFEDFQLRLPTTTRFVLQLSQWIQKYAPLFIGGLMLLFGLLPWARNGLERRIDKLQGEPKFASWTRGTRNNLGAMAIWSGTLAELLAMDAPPSDAMKTAVLASQRTHLLSKGNNLAESLVVNPECSVSQLGASRWFSRVGMLAFDLHRDGVDTSNLLRNIADSYAVRWCRRSQKGKNQWLTPIWILLLGGMTLLVLLMLFLPLFFMMQSLAS